MKLWATANLRLQDNEHQIHLRREWSETSANWLDEGHSAFSANPRPYVLKPNLTQFLPGQLQPQWGKTCMFILYGFHEKIYLSKIKASTSEVGIKLPNLSKFTFVVHCSSTKWPENLQLYVTFVQFWLDIFRKKGKG